MNRFKSKGKILFFVFSLLDLILMGMIVFLPTSAIGFPGRLVMGGIVGFFLIVACFLLLWLVRIWREHDRLEKELWFLREEGDEL